jgi:hypothetical protein
MKEDECVETVGAVIGDKVGNSGHHRIPYAKHKTME